MLCCPLGDPHRPPLAGAGKSLNCHHIQTQQLRKVAQGGRGASKRSAREMQAGGAGGRWAASPLIIRQTVPFQLHRAFFPDLHGIPSSQRQPHQTTVFRRPLWSPRPQCMAGCGGRPQWVALGTWLPSCPPGTCGLDVGLGGECWCSGALDALNLGGGEVCWPLQLGCVPWAEGSGVGSTACGALKTPGEGGAELALPTFAGSALGAEDRGFLGMGGGGGAHAEEGTEAGCNRGMQKGPLPPSPSWSAPHSAGYRGGWVRAEGGLYGQSELFFSGRSLNCMPHQPQVRNPWLQQGTVLRFPL